MLHMRDLHWLAVTLSLGFWFQEIGIYILFGQRFLVVTNWAGGHHRLGQGGVQPLAKYLGTIQWTPGRYLPREIARGGPPRPAQADRLTVKPFSDLSKCPQR